MSSDTSTLVHPAAMGPAVRALKAFRLDIEQSGQTTQAGPFTHATVGSARGNDVVLDDPTVSRFHFRLACEPKGLRLLDVGSTNGTFLQGHRVIDAFVQDDSRIRVGDTELVIRLEATPTLVDVHRRDSFGEMIAMSVAMRDLFGVLERLAAAEAPVLVQGETGTGKELIARAIHTESPRRSAPFVVVDCGAVTATLVESELFGHEKGAFTGAETARVGAFEAANGGTVFLDEIGELEKSLQPKLLRVLESQTVKPVGANTERSVDVRVVAATHRSLEQMVNDGTFREDLFFRLAVCPVTVPPLRDRTDDIPALAQHFFERTTQAALEGPAPKLTPEALALLRRRGWPGNVRELRNVVERAVILAEKEELATGDLSKHFRAGAPGPAPTAQPLESAKRSFERAYLIKLLARHPKDRAAAAAEADIHVKSLQRLLRKHGLLERE